MSRPAGLSLRVQDVGSGAICADVLAALPTWFGFPESVAAYVEAAETRSRPWWRPWTGATAGS